MAIMTANQNHRKAGYQQEAWPKRIPFYGTDTVIECTACRTYFTNGKAWKAHRRTGMCNTNKLTRNDLGIWTTPVRKRVAP